MEREIRIIMDNLGYEIGDADADLLIDNQVDSISFVELLVEIESVLNIVIPDQYLSMENFSTLNRIIETLGTVISNDAEIN